MKGLSLSILFTLLFSFQSLAQLKDAKPMPIQFSGKVVGPDENGDVTPLPYTTVTVKNSNRGDVSDYDGYFSFVALKGETVVFSRLGFEDIEFVIPDTLSNNFYTWIQVMTEDDYWLDEVNIYPWPSKDHFKQEFLAIDISNELRDHAQANLAENVMKDIRYTVPPDGREASGYVMRQYADEFRYAGQYRPIKIFDVMAWKRFIEAWKRGDFKRKKKKD